MFFIPGAEELPKPSEKPAKSNAAKLDKKNNHFYLLTPGGEYKKTRWTEHSVDKTRKELDAAQRRVKQLSKALKELETKHEDHQRLLATKEVIRKDLELKLERMLNRVATNAINTHALTDPAQEDLIDKAVSDVGVLSTKESGKKKKSKKKADRASIAYTASGPAASSSPSAQNDSATPDLSTSTQQKKNNADSLKQSKGKKVKSQKLKEGKDIKA